MQEKGERGETWEQLCNSNTWALSYFWNTTVLSHALSFDTRARLLVLTLLLLPRKVTSAYLRDMEKRYGGDADWHGSRTHYLAFSLGYGQVSVPFSWPHHCRNVWWNDRSYFFQDSPFPPISLESYPRKAGFVRENTRPTCHLCI